MRCRYLILILLMSVTACATKPIATEKAPVAAATSTTTQLIHVRAIYLEKMVMPTGSTLDLQLFGERADDQGVDVIARQSFGQLRGPPYDLDLPYDAGRIRAGTRYSLRASLRGADGHLAFATLARVPVVPGNPTSVEFRLSRVDAR